MSPIYRCARLAAIVCGTLVVGCAAPFSDLQSARLAGTGRIEATPSFSTVSFSGDGESERIQTHVGLQVATGIGARTDLRLRFERIDVRDEDFGANVIGFGPKFSLMFDRIALNLPVGFAFGSDIEMSETWQIHPTLLGTLPVHPAVELNGSIKMLVPLVERNEIDDLVAFNIGLGIGPDLARWAIRPEVGWMFNPGEDGHFRHFSIGLTYYFDRR
jgi:hypothetical protein